LNLEDSEKLAAQAMQENARVPCTQSLNRKEGSRNEEGSPLVIYQLKGKGTITT
jgi:hypothetical protein